MKAKSNRIRRFLAFLTDEILYMIPCILFSSIIRFSFFAKFFILIPTIAVITFFVTFTLRDYLFNGRSIGKRIFKLIVVDANTLSQPSPKQLIKKGLFLFLFSLDGLFLIFSGKSLGERFSHTIVLREQQLPSADFSSEFSQFKPTVKKRILVTMITILCFSIPMFLIVSAGLNTIKKQKNYQLAYSYLISSNTYSQLHTEESQIAFTAYSSSTKTDTDNETVSSVVTFTFLVQGQQYQVVCHRDGDLWYVCNDCTRFQ